MSKPTIPELNQQLKDLVSWQEFALYLPGIDQTDIRVIESDKRDDISSQKIALYEKWLHVYPEALWVDVIRALETVRENSIAKQLMEKYPTAIVTHPPLPAMPPVVPAMPPVVPSQVSNSAQRVCCNA